jgi:phosphoribosylglycinamide formyltransferase-1
MQKRVIIITADELRHNYFIQKVSTFKNIKLLYSLCEKKNTREGYNIIKKNKKNNILVKHFLDREKSEKKFFHNFIKKKIKHKKILINKSEFNNNKKIISKIKKSNPDIIISYGCSIIKGQLLKLYQKKIINIHLGLSPYYRGSGTNFWPFVTKKLQLIGATFMIIDSGIDTGPILFQLRARIYARDKIHDVGNRLIMDMTEKTEEIINNFPYIKPEKNYKTSIRTFKKKDFSENELILAKNNIKKNLIEKYLKNKTKIDKLFPIKDYY